VESLSSSIAATFAELQRKHPDEDFYGVALYLDGDSYSFEFIANSYQVIARELAKRSANTGTPVDRLQPNCPFAVSSWEYVVSRMPDAERAHGDLWRVCYNDGDGPYDYDTVKARIWRCIIDGLKQTFNSDVFSKFSRESFILIPWIHDPWDGKPVIDAVVEINHPAMASS
jgi:hypothetical protein